MLSVELMLLRTTPAPSFSAGARPGPQCRATSFLGHDQALES